MDDPRIKTAAVAIKEPTKFGNLAQIFSNVLLYRSDHVTAIGSAIFVCFLSFAIFYLGTVQSPEIGIKRLVSFQG